MFRWALSSQFLVSGRQTAKTKQQSNALSFFPFLLTLNTSINQQLHSVTTIVMLGE